MRQALNLSPRVDRSLMRCHSAIGVSACSRACSCTPGSESLAATGSGAALIVVMRPDYGLDRATGAPSVWEAHTPGECARGSPLLFLKLPRFRAARGRRS